MSFLLPSAKSKDKEQIPKYHIFRLYAPNAQKVYLVGEMTN